MAFTMRDYMLHNTKWQFLSRFDLRETLFKLNFLSACFVVKRLASFGKCYFYVIKAISSYLH